MVVKVEIILVGYSILHLDKLIEWSLLSTYAKDIYFMNMLMIIPDLCGEI